MNNQTLDMSQKYFMILGPWYQKKGSESNWTGTDVDQTTNPNIDIKVHTRT